MHIDWCLSVLLHQYGGHCVLYGIKVYRLLGTKVKHMNGSHKRIAYQDAIELSCDKGQSRLLGCLSKDLVLHLQLSQLQAVLAEEA